MFPKDLWDVIEKECDFCDIVAFAQAGRYRYELASWLKEFHFSAVTNPQWLVWIEENGFNLTRVTRTLYNNACIHNRLDMIQWLHEQPRFSLKHQDIIGILRVCICKGRYDPFMTLWKLYENVILCDKTTILPIFMKDATRNSRLEIATFLLQFQ